MTAAELARFLRTTETDELGHAIYEAASLLLLLARAVAEADTRMPDDFCGSVWRERNAAAITAAREE